MNELELGKSEIFGFGMQVISSHRNQSSRLFHFELQFNIILDVRDIALFRNKTPLVVSSMWLVIKGQYQQGSITSYSTWNQLR